MFKVGYLNLKTEIQRQVKLKMSSRAHIVHLSLKKNNRDILVFAGNRPIPRESSACLQVVGKNAVESEKMAAPILVKKLATLVDAVHVQKQQSFTVIAGKNVQKFLAKSVAIRLSASVTIFVGNNYSVEITTVENIVMKATVRIVKKLFLLNVFVELNQNPFLADQSFRVEKFAKLHLTVEFTTVSVLVMLDHAKNVLLK